MSEDYVSFEAARLLKKRGFKERCNHFYMSYGLGEHELMKSPVPINANCDDENNWSAPILEVAQRWLREKKDIHIMIDVCASGYYAVLWKTNGTFIKTLADKGPNGGGVWDSYKEALYAAIESALRFI